jgi:predicted HAD superfamily phosphohydrolase
MTPKIAPVTTNMEKKTAYQIQMERFKRAKAGGFHLEAIFILYALIEDRLSAFLFHAGITNSTREKITRNSKVRPHLDSTLTVLDTKQPSIRNVSAKIKLIKELMEWSTDYIVNEPACNYLDAICKQINRTAGKDQMIETLTRIEGWCVSRNELVHALLNKKVENQEEVLEALVAEGEACNRLLQNFVKSFKVRNALRKTFNIQ